MMRVKILPRLASAAPFLCLIVCHLEWPDMVLLAFETGLTGPEILALCRQNEPDISAFVPGASRVIAKAGVDAETRTLDATEHRGHRHGAEGQREPPLMRPAAA